MNDKRLIIFDLDDTLYLESDYVLSGLKVVAEFFSLKYKFNTEVAYSYLSQEFNSKGRDKLFDKLFSEFDLNYKDSDILRLVNIYREHSPTIKLSEYNKNLLKKLKESNIKLGIVTDGLPLMQRKKIEALGLNDLVDEIIYCWEIDAPKPDEYGFSLMIKKLGISYSDVLIIGDNPQHDILAANKLDIQSYRVLTGRFKNLPDLNDAPATKTFNALEEIFGKIS